MTLLPKAIYRVNATPIKLLMVFFTELEQKNLTIRMETQKTLKSQSNPEKEKQIWRNQAPWLQTIPQSYSNQHSMVLAQKQKFTWIVQDRMPRDKPTHTWAPNLQQRRQEHTMEKRQPLSKWCWENWTATCKRMKLEHSLTPYTKINSK